MAEDMNPLMRTDIPLTEGLSPESTDSDTWRTRALVPTGEDPVKVPASELLELRVAELRQSRNEQVSSRIISSYGDRLRAFSHSWPANPAVNATTEIREVLDILEKIVSEYQPAKEAHSVDQEAEQVEKKSKSPRTETTTLTSQELREALLVRISTNMSKVDKFVQAALEGYRSDIFRENEAIVTTLTNVRRVSDSATPIIAKMRWHDIPFTALKDALNTVDIVAPALTEEAFRRVETLTLSNLPESLQRVAAEEQTRQADRDEKEYRSSVEARCLRLLREIQTSPDESFNSSSARKIASQLARVDAAEIEKILGVLEPRLMISARDQHLFHESISQASAALVKRATADPKPASPEISASTDAPATEETTSPPVEDTREFLELFLDQYGIHDATLIGDLLPRFSLEGIERLERELGEINAEVVRLLIERTPEIIYPNNRDQLKSFLKQWRITLQDTAGLDSFEIFNPAKFPEHFSSITKLIKTSNAATLVAKVREQVTTEYYRLRAPQEEPTAPTAQQTDTRTAHPEQHLIDRLRPYTHLPNVAYGLLREGFFYNGSYKTTSGVPRSFRDRLLESVFTTKVHPKEMRRVERDLLKLGVLNEHSATSRGTDGLLSINRSVADPVLRQLVADLTDPHTRHTKVPKLPVRDEE